jgi:hypothetical protein
VAWVVPASAGTVQFTDTIGGVTRNLGAPVAVNNRHALTDVTGLAAGRHQFGATFTPSNPSAFAASTARPAKYTVNDKGRCRFLSYRGAWSD